SHRPPAVYYGEPASCSRPSGDRATVPTWPRAPSGAGRDLPLVTSQNWTAPPAAAARVLPSGERAVSCSPQAAGPIFPTGVTVVASQTVTVWSAQLAEKIRLPSGEK